MVRPFVTLLSLSEIAPSPEGALPDRFRIFRAGWNESTKGRVLFDERAARDVMAEHAARGVDLMLDLNHAAVDEAALAVRADAADAMGWFRLEVTADGELWAVGVRYTAEGESRIRARKQRYISPYFSMHARTARAQRLINCALVGMPATYGAQPLIAASDRGEIMDPKIIQDALSAIEAGDGAAAIEVLKALVASAAGDGDAPPADDGGAPDAMPVLADDPPEDDKDKQLRLRDDPRIDAVVARLDAIERRSSAADAARRIELVGELVKLGLEPITAAWADPVKRVPSKFYAAVALSDLEERVAACRVHAKTVTLGGSPRPPAPTGEARLAAFSVEEHAELGKIKDPEARERFIALRFSRHEEIVQ